MGYFCRFTRSYARKSAKTKVFNKLQLVKYDAFKRVNLQIRRFALNHSRKPTIFFVGFTARYFTQVETIKRMDIFLHFRR